MENRDRFQAQTDNMKTQLIILGVMVGLMWASEIVDGILPGHPLNALGVRPRTVDGLWGIALMPFLHSDFGHLLANTVPLFVLGWLTMLRGLKEFVAVTVLVLVLSGLGVWLFGEEGSVHIGASGLVFGYFGFLVLRGIFERSAAAIGVMLVVVMLYGSMVWGILPIWRGISWEGHLFGMVSGGIAGYFLAYQPEEEEEEEEDDIPIVLHDPYDYPPS